MGSTFSTQACVMLHLDGAKLCVLPTVLFALFFAGQASASVGDRLPGFRSCVSVRQKSILVVERVGS